MPRPNPVIQHRLLSAKGNVSPPELQHQSHHSCGWILSPKSPVHPAFTEEILAVLNWGKYRNITLDSLIRKRQH